MMLRMLMSHAWKLRVNYDLIVGSMVQSCKGNDYCHSMHMFPGLPTNFFDSESMFCMSKTIEILLVDR